MVHATSRPGVESASGADIGRNARRDREADGRGARRPREAGLSRDRRERDIGFATRRDREADGARSAPRRELRKERGGGRVRGAKAPLSGAIAGPRGAGYRVRNPKGPGSRRSAERDGPAKRGYHATEGSGISDSLPEGTEKPTER